VKYGRCRRSVQKALQRPDDPDEPATRHRRSDDCGHVPKVEKLDILRPPVANFLAV
jgi:hypothetical protein